MGLVIKEKMPYSMHLGTVFTWSSIFWMDLPED